MAIRMFLLGIPHTVTSPAWSGCAFTNKCYKFMEMFAGDSNYEIFHIGHADSEIPQASNIHHITVTDNSVLRTAYGTDYVDNQAWRENGFARYFNIDDSAYQHFHAESIKAITTLKQPNDLLLCSFGWGHKFIADAHSDLIVIESGIGYPSAFARWRVYESHSIRNNMYGIESIQQATQDNYHVVINNYFNSEDFVYDINKHDYILYLGRIQASKGVGVAIEVCQHLNKQLIIAGQGSLQDLGYSQCPDHVKLVGYADPAMRKLLMSKAQALFIASSYSEPFAGVQCEAWLSGTPVISPDYAAFAELNIDGVTGYRCRTFKDYVRAVENVSKGLINYEDCHKHGQKFTYSAIKPQYQRYFQDVLNVYTGKGWYEL